MPSFHFDREILGNTGMCGISINDTTCVFFGRFVTVENPFGITDHLAKFVLNVKDGEWAEKEYQFHDVNEYNDHELEIACASTIDKTLNR